jgi:transposase, IS30 family
MSTSHRRWEPTSSLPIPMLPESASWERGSNENANGLVRQYFPKGCDFTGITDQEVTQVMQRLNHRPRKTLGFSTPHQVFYELPPVALTP